MKQYLLMLLILLPSVSFAGKSKYVCVINQIKELTAQGYMEKHNGIYEKLIGDSFSINRITGEMKGLPFSTKSYKKISVLDKGSKENSYKEIVTSHPPNMWVMYIYVAEHNKSIKKPFWGTSDGNKMFSGKCE